MSSMRPRSKEAISFHLANGPTRAQLLQFLNKKVYSSIPPREWFTSRVARVVCGWVFACFLLVVQTISDCGPLVWLHLIDQVESEQPAPLVTFLT